MILQLLPLSLIRSSWHRGPMSGIGLDQGIFSESPSWSNRSRNPAWILASFEKGGDLTSPCNQTIGLSEESIGPNVCHFRHTVKYDLSEMACHVVGRENLGVTSHNSAYVHRRLGRRLGLRGAATRRSATQPLGPVGLGAGHIRAVRYAKFRQGRSGHR